MASESEDQAVAAGAEDADSGSLGSLSDEEICDDDALQGDTWIEELECALLADCDPATLKKICEGRRIPSTLRPDYWRAMLALNDAGKVKLSGEYDLENQLEIRHDCEELVDDIDANLATEPLSDVVKLQLRSNFESTLTTYVKARPELSYIPGNGWTDILKVLYHLDLNDTQLYQIFFRIVDRYIPKDLFHRPVVAADQQPQQPLDSKQAPETTTTTTTTKADGDGNSRSTASPTPTKASSNQDKSSSSDRHQRNITQKPMSKTSSADQLANRKEPPKSIQAYHLLRLLIQYHDPELCSTLDSRKVTPNLYVKDWFCSLFARSCSPKLALLIWDTHFKMADPFLIFFAAIVMVVNASDELRKKNMSQSEMLNVLKVMPSKLEEDDIEDLYYLVSNHYTNSTPRSIRCYSHLFFMDTFGNTYLGNESPEDGQPLLDLKTTQLTSSLDLSQYLCLPIVPAEIFTPDTAQLRASPTQSASSLKYFLVDCRPAEQYNAGHLKRAFHLDCSIMLREPSSFATAVQALLEIQRQVVASKSSTGGQHLCFIGSGQEEEDQYVNMVVASFLQKYQKYVSIVVGGFEAIHDYVSNKSELRDSFDKYIVDHNPELCKICYSRTPEGIERFKSRRRATNLPSASGSGSGLGSAQSLFASTTSFLRGDKSALASGTFSKLTPGPQTAATANLIAQSGASMFDKFTSAFVSKSSVIKDRLVETLNTTAMPSPALSSGPSQGRDHVSSHDKLGRRYTGSSLRYAIGDDDEDLSGRRGGGVGKTGAAAAGTAIGEPSQEIQIDVWQKQTKIIALYKCAQIKGSAKYPGYIALSKTHLWILCEIPHNKGFASISAKRPLDMIVQITSKRRQPDLIIFRYGYASQQQPAASSDNPNGAPQDSTKQREADGSVSTPPPAATTAPNSQKSLPSIVASDHLHIPQAFEVIRLIKREIVRIMDESSRANLTAIPQTSDQSQTISQTAHTTNKSSADTAPRDEDVGGVGGGDGDGVSASSTNTAKSTN